MFYVCDFIGFDIVTCQLGAHNKMFAQICILLKLWARTKFEA